MTYSDNPYIGIEIVRMSRSDYLNKLFRLFELYLRFH